MSWALRSCLVAAVFAVFASLGCGGGVVGGVGAKPNLATSEQTVASATPPPTPPTALVCTETTGTPTEGTIARVEIEGRDVPVALCAFLGSRAGGPWDEGRVDADVRAIWADGRVDDVVAFRESARQTLVFALRMRPSVGAFEVRGADTPGFPEEVSFDRPTYLNLATLREQSLRAERALRDAGWLAAKVNYTVTPSQDDEDGKVSVAVQVDAGPRALVEAIQLEGPQGARALELLALLRTTQGEPFDALMLERDVLVIQADGYDRGLVMTKVEEPEIVAVEGGKGVRIRLRVDEGQVFHIGKVGFEGDLIGSAKTYAKDLWSSAPSAIFSRSVVATDLDRIRTFHESHGRPVEVTPETTIDAEHGVIDLVVRITKRP